LAASAAKPERIGLALAWAGWGAIAAQRFSSGTHELVFGALVGGAGISFVVLTRIQGQRRLALASGEPRLASVSRLRERLETRSFREVVPESPNESDRSKN
jgi:hypothetical protein